MSQNRSKRGILSVEGAMISSIMWEIAAIVEVLEREGLATKQDLSHLITEFQKNHPVAHTLETVCPEPYIQTDKERQIIGDILDLLNRHGLTSHQSISLLGYLERIVEMGHWVENKTTH
jgi:hypothetical protein